MPKITQPGDYEVTIVSAKVKPTPRDDDPSAFALLLYCSTSDGFETIYEMFFSHKVIGSGRNQGLTTAESNVSLLKSLGVVDGYIGNIPKAINEGLKASVKVDWDERATKDGKTKCELRAKFLNPVRKIFTLDVGTADEFWTAFNAKKKAEISKPPEIAVAIEQTEDASEDDEIPF